MENSNNQLSSVDINMMKTESFEEVNQKLTIIPTIDISKGRAVLVCEGKVVKDNGDPLERADFLSINSDFQVVDLDRAMETGDNSEIIKKICLKYPCYVAGGIRNFDIANEFLNNNAKRVVIGTSANEELLSKLPENRIILALDIDEDFKLFKRGRKELSNENIFDKISVLAKYISFITVTFHFSEGTGKGIDIEKVLRIKNFINENKYKIRISVAGGINSVDEISTLINLGIIPQFGLGLWGGTFTLGDIYSKIMNYEKMMKFNDFKAMNFPVLFPCVILRSDGMPLGLTYTDSNGIKETLDKRKCVFYSRDRKKRWEKGETSGNYQTVVQVSTNCDRTALIYIVDGDEFCHLGTESCFNCRDPSKGGMLFLEKIFKKSLNSKNSHSYTKQIFNNKTLQLCKILEEANEIWTATTKQNLIYEISDLIYFLTLYSLKNELSIKEITNELTKRHYRLNKQAFIMSEIPKQFKIGICVTKHCEKKIFEFLNKNGIVVKKQNEELSRSLKYDGYFTKHPEVKIIPFMIKPKDVYKFMEYNLMDAVVCYQDVLDNYPVNFQKMNLDCEENFLYKTKICVISNEDFDISQYQNNPSKKLSIFSEYIYLTSLWTEKMNIVSKITTVCGCTEGFLVNRLCDLVVCVVDTGATVTQNNLKIVDTIYESTMGIFVKKGMENILENFIK